MPAVAETAVKKSTYGTTAFIGVEGSPDRNIAPGHGLPDRVEADAVRPWAFSTEGVQRGNDDFRAREREGLVVEPHGDQRLPGEIRYDDVRALYQLLNYLSPGWLHGVERHPPLATIALNEQGSLTGRGDWTEVSIFAAANLLDANDVSAEIGQKRAAEWPGDVATKIEHADAVKDAPSRSVSHFLAHQGISRSRCRLARPWALAPSENEP